MVILTMVIKWEERRIQWSVGRCRLNLTTCYLLRGRKGRKQGGRRKSVVRRIADMQPAAAARAAKDLARPHARGLEIYEEEEEEDDEEGRSRSVRGN